jgi:hypothetical protein
VKEFNTLGALLFLTNIFVYNDVIKIGTLKQGVKEQR